MAKRHKAPAHENHERWLVSYADFITLLFAFFVVMFASSTRDKERAAQVSESVRQALEQKYGMAKIASVLGGAAGDIAQGGAVRKRPAEAKKPPAEAPAPNPQAVELLPSLEYLSRELEAEVRAGRLRLSLEPRGLVVSLPQATFFPSGQDTIAPDTYPAIAKLAEVIRKLPNPVRLEGHTDSVPIHNERFRSNWELSAARSIAMMELLANRFGVPRHQMAIAGYADTVPADSNDTPEGRARNRRVDLVILNRMGALREPPAVRGAEARAAAGEGPG